MQGTTDLPEATGLTLSTAPTFVAKGAVRLHFARGPEADVPHVIWAHGWGRTTAPSSLWPAR